MEGPRWDQLKWPKRPDCGLHNLKTASQIFYLSFDAASPSKGALSIGVGFYDSIPFTLIGF